MPTTIISPSVATASDEGPAVSEGGYEWKAIVLLACGFGLVNLDRFIIFPLFPAMMKELGLNYQHLGLITGVLSLTWGFFSMWGGRLSDQVGRRAVLWPSVLIFSLMAGLTGLSAGLMSLLVIRGLMGASEGAYTPVSIVSAVEVSHPARRGLNVGLLQLSAPLMGAGVAPLLGTQLLTVLPSWRWVFLVVAVPGIIVAILIFRTIRDQPAVASKQPARDAGGSAFAQIARTRNVWLSLCVMFGCVSGISMLGAFMPNYLIDHLHLSTAQMGFVLSGSGLGGIVGIVLFSAMSDRFGRKVVIVGCMVASLPFSIALILTGANPPILFTLCALSSGLISGAIVVTVGPLISMSVPAAFASTATGLVIGFAEIFGGAVAPAIAGGLAEAKGIAIVLPLVLAGATAATLASFFIREPKRMGAV